MSGALALLCLASVVVVAAVVLQDPLVLALGAGLAVLIGWASYRLLRAEVVATRRECATERRDVARSYRDLFDRRADEVAVQQRRAADRLAEEGRTVVRLREAVDTAERRAGSTEAMLDDVRRRLGEAEERFAAMEAYAAGETSEDEMTIPLHSLEMPAATRVVPEWARLEADPIQALLAWEEHAGRMTGSHAVEERKRA